MRRKASKFDFKESSLPSNRKELFFDIFKNNLRVLLKIGLLLILFASPFIIVSLYKQFTNLNFYAQLSEGAITNEECAGYILFNDLVFDAINCITLGIIGIGIAGIVKIVKRLCFLDPVFFLEDFKAGIKDNGKFMFPLFFIFGLIILINNYTSNSAINPFISIIPLCITFSIVIPTFIITIMALAIYNIKLGKAIFVSFNLYIRTALKTLLAYIIFLVPFAVLLIPKLLTRWILFIVSLLILVPLTLVAFFDYSCSFFDKYINEIQYPEIYRKGLIDKNNNNNPKQKM